MNKKLGKEMGLNIDDGGDHWAFLDEMEAPMWVDLTVQSTAVSQHLDDAWFRTTHLYHQSSSVELKAAFAFSGHETPKLPSSVSGSRGKHPKSKTPKQFDFPWNKQHPVKVLSANNTAWISGSGQQIKPKVSFINSKPTWKPKRSFAVERDLSGNAKENNVQTISTHGDSNPTQNSSTVTSDNEHKIHPNNPEAFRHSNGLLSALRSSLRKSRVMRQASRVDVSNKKQSRDSNPVSGNSSVASSSTPGYKNPTFLLKQQREETSDSRNEARTSTVIKSKVTDSTSSKVSNIQGTCNSRTASRISNGSKPGNHNVVTKPKVQTQMVRAKALMPRGVNEQHSSSRATKAHKTLVSVGNENTMGRVPMNRKGNGGYITTGVMTRGLKGTKQDTLLKGNRTRLAGPKEKVSSPRSRGNHPTVTTQMVHLR
ncbi:hypothetical protein M5689_013552 [Euphorbia peplus]|nr:hypothetical protein M5689_013552 [Euphorbia peplus]